MDILKLSPRDMNYSDKIFHESCVIRNELVRNYNIFSNMSEYYKK